MKINPSNIQSPKQAKAFNFAQSVIKRVDTVFDAIKGYDQTDKDFNKTPGSVLVDDVLLSGRAPFTDCRTDGATIHQKGDTTTMEANAQIPGWGYYGVPIGLDTEMSEVGALRPGVAAIRHAHAPHTHTQWRAATCTRPLCHCRK